MPGGCLVETEHLLPKSLRVDVGDSETDVVGERAEVCDVVVHPFQLEEQGARQTIVLGDRDAGSVLHGHHVREGVTDGGVPADPLGQLDPIVRSAAFEELLDAPVHEPQASLQPEDRLADDREPKVSRLDETSVHRADRDLVDAVASYLQEGEGTDVKVEAWVGIGVVAHGVPAAGPVAVSHQSMGQGVISRRDAVQITDLALEPSQGVVAGGEARDHWLVSCDWEAELDAEVIVAPDQHVDDAQAVRVLATAHEGDPESVGEPRRDLGAKCGCCHLLALTHHAPPRTAAASVSSVANEPEAKPMTAVTPSASRIGSPGPYDCLSGSSRGFVGRATEEHGKGVPSQGGEEDQQQDKGRGHGPDDALLDAGETNRRPRRRRG